MKYSPVVFAGIALIFGSCAAVYKSMDPHHAIYANGVTDGGIEFAYRYNVLEETGNKRYSNKETRKGIQVVSVRIKNNSKTELEIGKSLNFWVNNSKVQLLDPVSVHHLLRQSPYIYLLYLGLVPIPLNVSLNGQVRGPRRGSTTSIPTAYYFVGPGLAAGNIFVATRSNKRFLKELKQYDLNNKIIKPGEEVFGLIGLPYNGYDPLFIEAELN